MTDTVAQSVWLLLAMTLVLSALVNRRLPAGRVLSLISIWVAILLGAYLLFQWLEPAITHWQQSRREGKVQVAAGRDTPTAAAIRPAEGRSTLRIPLSGDGHYWTGVTVNGRTMRFLIDSGASVTAISQSTADAFGLPDQPLGSMATMSTANGAIMLRRSVIGLMNIGGIIEARNLPVVVSPAFGDINVLGMNFLTKLKRWQVEDGVMTFEALP